ncbi:TonB-dependent siderophore receptor [Methylosinus sp. LW4]|uniref:TonB-dependent siderophore receptor n=1 Tax=Methylosinus sp. LW4 TaxID=136993 RepID=UPI0003760790|nr:TonB-dependent receptor [Methylosinus sp. LW4]
MGSALASLAMSAFATGAGVSGSPAQAAIAPEDALGVVRSYRIPGGSVAAALNDLADESGLHVAFPAGLTQGLRTPGLSGAHSLREALDRLLAGTRLTYALTDNRRTVLITLAQNDTTRSDAGAEALPTIDIGAERSERRVGPSSGKPSLTPQNSYVTPVVSTGTKTDTPVMNTPVNVQAITQKAIEDQGTTTLADALTNVSGVNVPGSSAAGSFTVTSGIYVRGFQTREFYQDGFRVSGSQAANTSAGTSQDLVAAQQLGNVSSIELLKGPGAAMYGLSQPGGLINITTKGPTDAPHYTVQQSVGSLARYITSVAASGPVTADKSVLYRVDLSYNQDGAPRGFFMDRVHARDFLIAPQVKWQIDDNNWLKLEASYNNNLTGSTQNFMPMINGNFVYLSRSINFNDWRPVLFGETNLTLTGEHKFDDDWKLRSRVNFSAIDGSQSGANVPSATPGNPANPLLIATTPDILGTSLVSAWQTNQDLVGHFDFFGTKSTVLAGGDYYRNTNQFGTMLNRYGTQTVNTIYPTYPGIPTFTPGIYYKLNIYNRQDTAGLYLQEQIELPYNIHVMAGARYQYIFNWNTTNFNINRVLSGQYGYLTGPAQDSGVPTHQARVTPRFGLLWRPREWVSLYGNYTEGFDVNNALIYPNQAAPAQNAMSWETGAKFELFDGQLRATADYFYLIKTNLPIADPDPTHICGQSTTGGCSLLIGAARSKGVEVDMQGRLAPGWDVIVSYTNQEVHVTSLPAISTSAGFGESSGAFTGLRVGDRYRNVPRNLARLWTTYEFQDERLTGLKLGVGYTYRGSMWLNDRGLYGAFHPQLSSYGLVDLMASYTFDLDGVRTTAQINAKNIFDRNYYTAGSVIAKPSPVYSPALAFIDPGSPFNITGSLRFDF